MELKLTLGRVRHFKASDASSLACQANNRNVWLNVRDTFPHPYTLKDAETWIQNANGHQTITHFAIEVGGRVAGGIGLSRKQDVYRRSAELGYWLGEEFWDRGIATEAVIAVSQYAFAQFDLARLYACVFEWNPASMRVLQKAGFNYEARLRKNVTKDGRTIDEFVFAKIRK